MVYEFDMQTRQQASEWRIPTEPKPKIPCQSHSKLKVMFTVFFDHRGVTPGFLRDLGILACRSNGQ
jgi:hypothetical protein